VICVRCAYAANSAIDICNVFTVRVCTCGKLYSPFHN